MQLTRLNIFSSMTSIASCCAAASTQPSYQSTRKVITERPAILTYIVFGQCCSLLTSRRCIRHTGVSTRHGWHLPTAPHRTTDVIRPTNCLSSGLSDLIVPTVPVGCIRWPPERIGTSTRWEEWLSDSFGMVLAEYEFRVNLAAMVLWTATHQ